MNNPGDGVLFRIRVIVTEKPEPTAARQANNQCQDNQPRGNLPRGRFTGGDQVPSPLESDAGDAT